LGFQSLTQSIPGPARFQSDYDQIEKPQEQRSEGQPHARNPKQNDKPGMLARIQRRLENRESRDQHQHRQCEQHDHGFASRFLIANNPPGRVCDETDGLQRFFVRRVLNHACWPTLAEPANSRKKRIEVGLPFARRMDGVIASKRRK